MFDVKKEAHRHTQHHPNITFRALIALSVHSTFSLARTTTYEMAPFFGRHMLSCLSDSHTPNLAPSSHTVYKNYQAFSKRQQHSCQLPLLPSTLSCPCTWTHQLSCCLFHIWKICTGVSMCLVCDFSLKGITVPNGQCTNTHIHTHIHTHTHAATRPKVDLTKKQKVCSDQLMRTS